MFWSIEALFHDKHNPDRNHAVRKVAETSSVELYHFLQAFVQAAPQIMLQLYIILRENVFRNYETSKFIVTGFLFIYIFNLYVDCFHSKLLPLRDL